MSDHPLVTLFLTVVVDHSAQVQRDSTCIVQKLTVGTGQHCDGGQHGTCNHLEEVRRRAVAPAEDGLVPVGAAFETQSDSFDKEKDKLQSL